MFLFVFCNIGYNHPALVKASQKPETLVSEATAIPQSVHLYYIRMCVCVLTLKNHP